MKTFLPRRRSIVGTNRPLLLSLLCITILAGCTDIGEESRDAPERTRAEQTDRPEERRDESRPDVSGLVIGFYNVENLFDTRDDPDVDDEEFLPRGRFRWTEERVETKLENLARAIKAIDGNNGPDILGVCEVENGDVLDRLVGEYLPRNEYAVVHRDSPDNRGIDVALIYRSAVVTAGEPVLHPVPFPRGERPTRGILEVPFERDGVRFTVMVNHWPSRSGGAEITEAKRLVAAGVAAGVVDSLTALDPAADIVLVGDFNDEPSDRSVAERLGAAPLPERAEDAARGSLFNLAYGIDGEVAGSYLYDGEWELIDQIIVSPGLLDRRGLGLDDRALTIHHPDFLRDHHPSEPLNPPRRTFVRGYKYIGGTSDHFPVYARFSWGSGDRRD